MSTKKRVAKEAIDMLIPLDSHGRGRDDTDRFFLVSLDDNYYSPFWRVEHQELIDADDKWHIEVLSFEEAKTVIDRTTRRLSRLLKILNAAKNSPGFEDEMWHDTNKDLTHSNWCKSIHIGVDKMFPQLTLLRHQGKWSAYRLTEYSGYHKIVTPFQDVLLKIEELEDKKWYLNSVLRSEEHTSELQSQR